MKPQIKELLKVTDAILISSRSNIVYLTDYSGFSLTEREGLLLFTQKKKFIITDGRYSEAILKKLPEFELIDIGALRFLHHGHDVLKNINLLGVEEDDLKVSEYRALKKHVTKLTNIDLSKLRILKDQHEIRKIKNAYKIADDAFKFILGELEPGVSEKQIASKLDKYFKENADDISFNPCVAFGNNSSIPHHTSGDKKLKKDSIVLFDFGSWLNNYSSDLSRTIFFGKAPEKFKDIHKTVLEAQQKSIDIVKDGIKSSDVDKAARDFILSKGYPNIIHSVGHGIGIEVHEAPHISPRSIETLKEGMVFTIEPGIYIPGYGGVRIEDAVVVKENSAELISHSQREIIEI
jgi:Xaa-Pro aminopeptidase